MTKHNVDPEIKKLKSMKVSLEKKYAMEPINTIAFALVSIDLLILELSKLSN